MSGKKKSQSVEKKDLPYCWTLFLKAPSVSREQAKTTKPELVWFCGICPQVCVLPYRLQPRNKKVMCLEYYLVIIIIIKVLLVQLTMFTTFMDRII